MTDHRLQHVVENLMHRIPLDKVDMSDGDRTKLKVAIRQGIREAYNAGSEGVQHDVRELLGIAHPESGW